MLSRALKALLAAYACVGTDVLLACACLDIKVIARMSPEGIAFVCLHWPWSYCLQVLAWVLRALLLYAYIGLESYLFCMLTIALKVIDFVSLHWPWKLLLASAYMGTEGSVACAFMCKVGIAPTCFCWHWRHCSHVFWETLKVLLACVNYVILTRNSNICN